MERSTVIDDPRARAPASARHLDEPQAVLVHHQGRLDLRIVVRIVGGEERDAAPVQRLKA